MQRPLNVTLRRRFYLDHFFLFQLNGTFVGESEVFVALFSIGENIGLRLNFASACGRAVTVSYE